MTRCIRFRKKRHLNVVQVDKKMLLAKSGLSILMPMPTSSVSFDTNIRMTSHIDCLVSFVAFHPSPAS